MRSPNGNAHPIKALFLLTSLSASSMYVQYASSPPHSRLNIIFDLEMVLATDGKINSKYYF
jgi:hypothetical protein